MIAPISLFRFGWIGAVRQETFYAPNLAPDNFIVEIVGVAPPARFARLGLQIFRFALVIHLFLPFSFSGFVHFQWLNTPNPFLLLYQKRRNIANLGPL